jgi:hypothetical protein
MCFILWCSGLCHPEDGCCMFFQNTAHILDNSMSQPKNHPSFHHCKTSSLNTSFSFHHRTPVMYGPAPHPGYTYGPPKVPTLSYYPGVQFVGNGSGGGYPDRRYKLPPQFLSADPYLYTTLLQPATQYNPDDWWERQATQNIVAGRKWGGPINDLPLYSECIAGACVLT